MPEDHQASKLTLDSLLAVPAVTSPAWWAMFDGVTHVLLVLGGLILLALRINIAWNERKSRHGHRRRAGDHE